MRRSLAALVGGLVLATVGCGGGGGGSPQTGTPDNKEPAVSVPGPSGPAAPTVDPMMPPPGLVGEILPPIEDDTQRLTQARKQVDALNNAVLLYVARRKDVPPALEVLAQPGIDGTPAYIDHGLLVDPWGASIQFDPAGKRNKNKQPDIWSLGPPSGTVHVGNWSDKPTPAN